MTFGVSKCHYMARAYNMLSDIYVNIETDIFEIIQQQVPVFENSLSMLGHSLDRCKAIKGENKHSPADLEKLEALKNRFIYVCDIFLNIFLPLIDKMDKEKNGTVIDKIMRAEKKKVIDKADTLIRIRNIRHDLERSHLPESAEELLNLIRTYSPCLFDYFNGFMEYARNRKFYMDPDIP